MSILAKSYEPGDVEDRWYSEWIENKCFSPGDADEAKGAYSIVIPPPNVTGVLTMGHVLNNTIQDILMRRARQKGQRALWIPGTDHAGIATQTRVERELRKEGKTRHDLGREAFLKQVREWREKHGGIIIEQLKKLGCSCDWEREVFTMDDEYSERVIHSFCELYRRGYIYRGKRMVNWCPVSLTALSDEEVIMKPQQGVLYHMRYEVVDQPGRYLEIATTRPETLMGDTAVAVHPEDERYKDLIGKKVWRPFPREAIPIVADTHIDREFGTGVLKVTPAHDKVDFEIGVRHNLPVIDVLTPDGKLNELAGEEFAGMDRFDARKAAARKLDELGLLVKEEPYENNVGFSERADVPVEPRLSEQWFLRYPKVEEAKEVVRQGLIRFYPERWVKTYLHWLENIQDWCISRQLWWGHRIPVWYRKGADRKDSANWHISEKGPQDPENWEQDEDVLDTWASSWLWPLATMGWPDEQQEKQLEMKSFYPTSALVTGPDIIFFWVARMIVAGLEFYGEEKQTLTLEECLKRIPFRDVYFTGIIRDIQGRKMSKSLGNSPDPLDLIARYGADGLRFGIMAIAPQGQDIRFSEDRVEQGRNFCNKLWNASRFRQMQGDLVAKGSRVEELVGRISAEHFCAEDEAIIQQLIEATGKIEEALNQYDFSSAAQMLYHVFWNDFCDWYVEVSKGRAEGADKQTCLAVQDVVLRQLLLLMHPYLPFITEELWHSLGFGKEGEFIQNVGPLSSDELRALFEQKGLTLRPQVLQQINQIRQLISQGRALKAQYQVASRNDVRFALNGEAANLALVEKQKTRLLKLIGASEIQTGQVFEDAPAQVTPLGTLYLDLASSVDVEAELARLSKEQERLGKQASAGRAKLQSPAFVDKAPAHIVDGARKQLQETEDKLAEVNRLIAVLSK